jgi:hypothetical protein
VTRCVHSGWLVALYNSERMADKQWRDKGSADEKFTFQLSLFRHSAVSV